MHKLIVDNTEYEVKEKKNLLEVCLSLGLNLPYFCWHPAMQSVGACRQCAVTKYKDEKDSKGKLIMACMEPVADGIRISINDNESKKFRKSVIEWLMTNHPHDCPVCDEGGECHLQDMTVMAGHTYRNHRYKKRTFRNQYLGPFINHEMNRCIQCYRCTRFYREYADGRDFNAFASRNYVYFGRSEDGILENEFSGNLVEVCPTGVFTDKSLKKHYTRKWDFTYAPSVCHNCGVGCNIIAAERYGSLRRIMSRYNSKVNGYFICDRGRFGYEWVNGEKRILNSLIKNKTTGIQGITNKETITKKVAELISSTKTIGIGSPKASLESNFALRKLVGKENFYSGIIERENNLLKTSLEILTKGAVRTPSLREAESYDCVFILGEDVTNTAPMLALSIRQAVKLKPKSIADELNIPLWNDAAVKVAVQEEKGPLYIASISRTKLSDIAKQNFYASPDDIAGFGFAVANILNNSSPAADNFSDVEMNLAKQIADDLKNAEKPLIVTGFGCASESVIKAAYNIALSLQSLNDKTGIIITSPDVNSVGLALMENKSLESSFDKIESGDVDTMIILENNLFRNLPGEKLNNILSKVKDIIVLSPVENQTTLKADYIIPVGTFAESDGTVVNNEARAQRFYQCFLPEDDIFESWRWLGKIGIALGEDDFNSLKTLDDFVILLVEELSQFEGIQKTAPPSGYRRVGQKIPRQTHRFSGRTAMNANKNVSEPKQPDDIDSPLSFTMEGFKGAPPSSAIPFFWSPGWNSVQSINKYQIEVGGPLHDGDPGVRLIAHNREAKTQLNFYKEIPQKFIPRDNEYLLVPLYHIYGSEEYSSLSSAVKERIPDPYIGLSRKDAEKLNVKESEPVAIIIEDKASKLPVKILKELPDGIAGYPVLQSMPFVELNSFKKITKTNG